MNEWSTIIVSTNKVCRIRRLRLIEAIKLDIHLTETSTYSICKLVLGFNEYGFGNIRRNTKY